MPIDGDEKGNKVNTEKGAVLFSFLFFRAPGGGGGWRGDFIVSKNDKNYYHPKFHACRPDYTYCWTDYSTFTPTTAFCRIHFSASPMFNFVSFPCLIVTGLIREHSCPIHVQLEIWNSVFRVQCQTMCFPCP